MGRRRVKEQATGTCPVCLTQQPLASGKRYVKAHVVAVEMVDGSETYHRCDGTDRLPIEQRTKARERTKDRIMCEIAEARADALVVLDVIATQTPETLDVNKLFPGRVPKLLDLALKAYRLKWTHSRIDRLYRCVPRYPKSHNLNTNATSRPSREVDVFCTCCGEMLIANTDRTRVAEYPRGKPWLIVENDRLDIIRRHTTPCALQCLAGLKEFAPPSHRHLPDDEVAGQFFLPLISAVTTP